MLNKPNKITRRGLLKSAAATAGVAAGSGALTGFPTIWAQNIKDIVLRHAGPPVTAIPAIAEQASKDLGFTVQMQATEQAVRVLDFEVNGRATAHEIAGAPHAQRRRIRPGRRQEV